MEVLAVIPARGGSRRVPRKNMRILGGKPLLAWTVEAARASTLVTRVVVSTEDTEIGRCAQDLGAIWLCRSEGLDGDNVPSAPVVMDALEIMCDSPWHPPRIVVLLHPTSPFRTAEQIDDCVRQCQQLNGISVISFTGDELNGAIYVSNTERFLRNGTFFAPLIWPYTMDERTGLDIDTPEDWALAESYL